MSEIVHAESAPEVAKETGFGAYVLKAWSRVDSGSKLALVMASLAMLLIGYLTQWYRSPWWLHPIRSCQRQTTANWWASSFAVQV